MLSEHFDELVSILNLKDPENLLPYHEKIDDSIFAAIRKFQNHPSTKSIRKKNINDKSSIPNVTLDCIKYEI